MRFGHIEIPVSDPLASARWYAQTLGFELEANQADRFLWLRLGDVQFLLRPGFAGAPEDDLAAVNLVLYTDDLEAGANRLREHGVTFERRAGCLHFRDPDGHWLQLVDPADDHSGGA